MTVKGDPELKACEIASQYPGMSAAEKGVKPCRYEACHPTGCKKLQEAATASRAAVAGYVAEKSGTAAAAPQPATTAASAATKPATEGGSKKNTSAVAKEGTAGGAGALTYAKVVGILGLLGWLIHGWIVKRWGGKQNEGASKNKSGSRRTTRSGRSSNSNTRQRVSKVVRRGK